MDFVTTILTGSDANAFFGKSDFPLSNETLEATLRFVALKHHQGDIEKVKAINVSTGTFYDGNDGTNMARHAEAELSIYLARSGASLLTINEEGWVSLDTPPYPVAPFLSKFSETRIYVNEAKKQTFIFVRNATEKWIDGLCSSMFRVLPWYFKDGISAEEMALFKALNERNSEAFKNVINKACEGYDFRGSTMRRILIGWGDGSRQQQIANLKKQCEQYISTIAAHERTIADNLAALDNVQCNLVALEAQKETNSNEVYDFFTNHKQLAVIASSKNSNGNVLNYRVSETIEYYDKDAFMRMYENESSCIGGARRDLKELFYCIFCENKGVFRTQAVFQLTNLSAIRILQHVAAPELNGTHIPHPHLVGYGCLGGNGNYINKYLMQGSWDLAIEQTIAAVKNVNFGDVVVMSSFIRDVSERMTSCKCIIADNGKEMTPAEFLIYLRNSKANEGTENG